MCTYAKLRDGSWGVKVPGKATAGQTVTVEKKSGERRTERIARVLWSGDGVSLCSIAVVAKSASYGGRNRQSGYCDECGERAEPGTRCWETGMTH
jgi:hypothetical protein